jgi:hypothetical protein
VDSQVVRKRKRWRQAVASRALRLSSQKFLLGRRLGGQADALAIRVPRMNLSRGQLSDVLPALLERRDHVEMERHVFFVDAAEVDSDVADLADRIPRAAALLRPGADRFPIGLSGPATDVVDTARAPGNSRELRLRALRLRQRRVAPIRPERDAFQIRLQIALRPERDGVSTQLLSVALDPVEVYSW